LIRRTKEIQHERGIGPALEPTEEELASMSGSMKSKSVYSMKASRSYIQEHVHPKDESDALDTIYLEKKTTMKVMAISSYY